MWFIDNIVIYCNNISSFFYSIYLEVLGWVFPFWLVASFFYNLSTTFSALAWQFYYFGLWVDATASKLLEILSWSTIQSYITDWFYLIGDLNTIFFYFWANVTDVINNWWSSTSLSVLDWINAFSAFLQSQIDVVNSWLTNLQLAWDSFKDKIPSLDLIISWFSNWWGYVLNLVIAWGALTATQIQSLIDSAFTAYTPFWEGWLDWKDSLIEFIQDPWQWLYDRVEDLFDRFW